MTNLWELDMKLETLVPFSGFDYSVWKDALELAFQQEGEFLEQRNQIKKKLDRIEYESILAELWKPGCALARKIHDGRHF